jgi:hypothetical protein
LATRAAAMIDRLVNTPAPHTASLPREGRV